MELELDTARGIKRAPAAVFRPGDVGSHPVVVYLHGDSGLGAPMLAWAPKLAEAGFIALVGRYKPAPMTPGRIDCSDCPLAQEGLAALLDVAHRLPGARTDSVGILGLTGGAVEALRAARRSDVQAVVLIPGRPPPRTRCGCKRQCSCSGSPRRTLRLACSSTCR